MVVNGSRWLYLGSQVIADVRKDIPASLPKSRRNCGMDARCGSQTSERATFCESPGAHRRVESDMILFCSSMFKSAGGAAEHRRRRRPLRCAGARRPVSRVLYPSPTAGDGHSSGTPVTGRLARPTRTAARKPACRPPLGGCRRAVPIWSCSRWGLPCRRRRRRRGALLPHPFTLAGGPQPRPAVCFLWHCPWGRPRRALPGTVFPWSPDFPPPPP
jgi:hypothetical protein